MNKLLSAQEKRSILATLETRFLEHTDRHKGLDWATIKARLEADPGKLWSLDQMEQTGGEPDVVGQDKRSGAYIFIDCSKESPAWRRSLCYDQQALVARNANKPRHSALGLADEMGITLLNEEQYKTYHALVGFDQKTSSWVLTPPAVRALGGAIFCDFRFGRVFTYHNGADAYYGSRGFRGILEV